MKQYGRFIALGLICTLTLGAAIDIDRLFNWFNEVPKAKTRVSRFKALAIA